jgi:NAD(P)-dependent dehydrogenase (short-subunit alcohol dehydrogenase family)
VAFPALSVYHATKFAVEGMSESLAQEVAPFGIKVMIIEPGALRTEWTGRSAVFAQEHADYAGTPAAYVRNRVRNTHGQQSGDPALAAQIIVDMAQRDAPPLRLPLGPDAFLNIRQRFETDLHAMAEIEPTATATSFAQATGPVAPR